MSLVTAAGVSLVNQVSVRNRASSRRPIIWSCDNAAFIDGGTTLKDANVYSLDQLIGGECGSSARRRPRIVFNVPASSNRAAMN